MGGPEVTDKAINAGRILPDAQWTAAMRMGSATLYEAAGQVGALPSAIRCMTPGLRMVGSAVTVSGPPGDNLWIHRAVYAAHRGDVLVVSVGGDYEAGYWGEILSCAAQARGLVGVVLDGGVRDTIRLAQVGLPVFARGPCIRGTTKNPDGTGSINQPLTLGNVRINPGDLIVADEDGILALPNGRIDEILMCGRARLNHEAEIITALQRGARTLELYNLPE